MYSIHQLLTKNTTTMKTVLIGKLVHVGQVEVKDSYKQQKITIVTQTFDRNSGQPSAPETFSVMIFNKAIDNCQAEKFNGKVVAATCWLRSFSSEKDGVTYHNLALNCSDIKEA